MFHLVNNCEYCYVMIACGDLVRSRVVACHFDVTIENNVNVLKDGNDQYLFKNLGQFCLDLLCLPHSNATCERIFSKYNLIKTKIRNKLKTDTVNGLLLSSQCVKNANSCFEFKPTKEMFKYYANSKILYSSSGAHLNENEEHTENQDVLLDQDVLVV